MRYRWKNLPSLLISRQGRKSLFSGQLARFWPLIRIFTAMYRRTVLRKVRVAVVIGSLGKSTTARAVAVALGHRQPDGISNSRNALAFDLLGHSPKNSHAVVEAGVNGPGIMRRTASMLNPDIVVVTSIASEHILSFGNLDNTRNEKAEMLRVLTPQKTAILNADDPNVMWMASQTSASIITCGFSDSADVRASNFQILPPGRIGFLIKAGEQSWPIRLSILGRHMVFPILAAVAVAIIEGREISSVIASLEEIKALEGRMQPVVLTSGALLIRDDFKSNRESVWEALAFLKDYPARRKILVLGGLSEIQNSDRYEFYRELGKKIADSADYALLFLRKNSYRRCRNEATAAGMNPENIVRIEGDPLAALPLIPGDLGKGDVILIKGRNDYRTSRLSLRLMGHNVKCRLPGCHLPIDCGDCELLEQLASDSPLLGPNLKRD